MNKKVTIRHAVSAHLRGIRELHKVSRRFFPLLTLYCLFDAVFPYLSVFFSAQVLKELAGGRRADILWGWVVASVLCVGAVSILKAVLEQRYNTLLNDLWGRKEILFIRKMFSLDFSELDKQETHDLRAQIQQNENWSNWGLMRIHRLYTYFVTGVIGLISGIALTVSLFTSSVPADAGWLTVLNNPLFILFFAALMVGVSVLAGKLSAAATKSWSRHGEEATFGNRMYGHFGFIGLDKERSVDIRMSHQQNLVRAYWTVNPVFGVDGPLSRDLRGKLGI